jgi:3-methyladenine DNA glycosylase/8-oxoguanine DNA glycosylase
MPTAAFRFPFPVDLRLTLGRVKGIRFGGRSGLPPGGWWATRTPEGSATLHLTGSNGVLAAEAWGPGATWVIDQVPRLVGAEDEPEGLVPPHSTVRRLSRELAGLRIGRTDRFFEAMVPMILAQKVTGREASRSFRALVRRYGEPAPGPVPLIVPPSPEVLAGLRYYDLHPLGVEQRRALTLLGVARRAARVEEAGTMPRSDAYRRLTAFPGVGAWTAAKVMASAAGDADAVPVGDYHLPNLVCWSLAGEERGDDQRMLALLNPYRGHRGRVIRMLELSGNSPPAYGPRTPGRDFARQ